MNPNAGTRVALVALVIGAAAHAATLRVPSEHPTILAGLDAAVPGDTVLVAPGTYTGDWNRELNFRGKDLVLVSEGGPSMTVIDCHTWQGIIFHQGETRNAVVDGFTLEECYYG